MLGGFVGLLLFIKSYFTVSFEVVVSFWEVHYRFLYGVSDPSMSTRWIGSVYAPKVDIGLAISCTSE